MINGLSSARKAIPRPIAPLSIIADKLAMLREAADAMPGLDPVFRRTLDEAEALARGLEPYLAACTTPQSPALNRLVAETQSEDWSKRFSDGETRVALEQEMLSGHIEGQFLKSLIYALKAKRVLEIGLFTGYSALAMAEALPGNGTLIACEIDSYAANFAQRAFRGSPHGQKIRIELGNAVDSMKRLAVDGASFDFIFIDADKGNYQRYFELAIEGSLLAPGGLICVDNTLMQGQPYVAGEPTANGLAIAEFNRQVANDPRVEQVLLPLRDGLTIIRRTDDKTRSNA